MNGSSTPPVIHNENAHRYEVEIEGALAVAEYKISGNRMVFTHTFVPPELRGKNIAAELVKAGLAGARAAGKRVVPQCSYVARFIERHSEYADLLDG
jgi:hypothetical protein